MRRAYVGLGPPDQAVRVFEGLTPYARQMIEMKWDCTAMGPEYLAMAIALDALQSAAYHFTRRPDFYHGLDELLRRPGGGDNRLSERRAAVDAFEALQPYAAELRRLAATCRPFGRDHCALEIARQGLESAAYHFTRYAAFYGARGDSASSGRSPYDGPNG